MQKHIFRLLTALLCISTLGLQAQVEKETFSIKEYKKEQRKAKKQKLVSKRMDYRFVLLDTQGDTLLAQDCKLSIYNQFAEAGHNIMITSITKKALEVYDGRKKLPGSSITTTSYSIEQTFYKDLAKGIVVEEPYHLYRKYVIDSLPPVQWEVIEGSTRKIGGYLCQEARAFFLGKSYIAWFTAAIPLGHGPWKLQGTPGLILEAYSEDKTVQFLFQDISNVQQDPRWFPTPDVWISRAAYRQLLQEKKQAIAEGKIAPNNYKDGVKDHLIYSIESE
jgi:GLPGLI family protein